MRNGARALRGGRARAGTFFEPTVLTGVTPSMLLMHEETFGPVAPLIRFQDEGNVVRMANSTPYGLAAYLWTRDLARAHRVSEALDFGIVGINDGAPSSAQAPFGRVKASGQGREGGPWGLQDYLDIKYVSVNVESSTEYSEKGKQWELR